MIFFCDNQSFFFFLKFPDTQSYVKVMTKLEVLSPIEVGRGYRGIDKGGFSSEMYYVLLVPFTIQMCCNYPRH